MTLPGECGRLTWRSWHAPPEEPTAKHMKNKAKKPRFSSLRQFSWSGSGDKGEDEELIESTVLEWYDQKQGKTSPGNPPSSTTASRATTPSSMPWP